MMGRYHFASRSLVVSRLRSAFVSVVAGAQTTTPKSLCGQIRFTQWQAHPSRMA